MGQEIFNACILFAAVAMLGWHNVWMGRHGRELAAQMNAVGDAVRRGSRPLYALALVVAIAVLREGSEIVLFLYGIAVASQAGAAPMLTGGALGLAAGIAVGTVIYFGLLRLPVGALFAATTALILFLAAGMASQGAAFLNQAGVLPALGNSMWDTSGVIADNSIAGQVLHVLVGYTAEPSGIQIVFYLATLVAITGLMWLMRAPPAPKVSHAAT
jgi:high-affinity iron transporter